MKTYASIIIAGAGPAGLTAAYQILKKNTKTSVTIVEQNDFFGGLSGSREIDGNIMDFGPHRYHSENKKVLDFFEEIMPLQGTPSCDDALMSRQIKFNDKGPNPNKQDNVMLKRKRISRIYFNGQFYDYPVKLNAKTLKNLGFGTSLNVFFSYLKATIFKKDESNLENFYINRFGKKLYQMFFEYYTENLWGRHPQEIDSSWGESRVSGISIKKVLLHALNKNSKHAQEKSFVDTFRYPKYGSGQFWDIIAEKVRTMGGNIIMNTKVEKIHVHKNAIHEIELSNGSKIITDTLISTMPIKNLINSLNNVPNNIKNIANKLPYRDYILCAMLVDKLKIENSTEIKTIKNQIPDVWIYIQDRNVKLGRIVIFNNFSPYIVSDYKNSVWIGLEYFVCENDKYWNIPEKEFQNFATDELNKIGIIDKNTNILLTHVEKCKKAYPAYFDGYNEIEKINEYINNIDGIACIGRNGKHQYNNIDDSILDGLQLAERLENHKITNCYL